MLKGWNRKVRMTSAMMPAWIQQADEFAEPPSLRFAPLVTLIGLSSLAGAPQPCSR
jgi:hypothetical protein